MELTTINSVANRNRDAELVYGDNFLVIEFYRGKLTMNINPCDRDNNKSAIADIESMIHTFIGEPITNDTLMALHEMIYPTVKTLKEASFSVRF